MPTTAPSSLYEPVIFASGLSPVDIWQSLHVMEHGDGDLKLMADLQNFPAKRWINLCNGAGWTPIGLAALSWCEGVDFISLLRGWEMLGAQHTPHPGTPAYRAARLLNPTILPSPQLSTILHTASSSVGFIVLWYARAEAPKIDMTARDYAYVEPEIQRLIQSAKPDMSSGASTQNVAPHLSTPEPAQEPEHLDATVANMLRQRKAARGWSEDEIAAALAAGAEAEVSGFPYLKAFRFSQPGRRRSVVADENARPLHVGREEYVYSDMLAQAPIIELPPMAEPGAANNIPDTIHVPLMGEFISVWRPVKARRLNSTIFLISDQQDAFRDEAWGMGFGPRVHCEARRMGEDLMLFFKSDAEPRR